MDIHDVLISQRPVRSKCIIIWRASIYGCCMITLPHWCTSVVHVTSLASVELLRTLINFCQPISLINIPLIISELTMVIDDLLIYQRAIISKCIIIYRTSIYGCCMISLQYWWIYVVHLTSLASVELLRSLINFCQPLLTIIFYQYPVIISELING